ncbi:MAG: nitrogen regulation protein NR(I) [Wenzhouxiangella sp.]|nr:nitrogen regulation protein NR(I) [Wenzhouxiangella sp.]MCH8476844.1 nitrogen regulation protein NR(I) [Wenzhouxiangella sp.]
MSRSVWVVEDDHALGWVLERALLGAGFDVSLFRSADDALLALAETAPAAIIADLRLPGESGLSLLGRSPAGQSAPPVIVMTAQSDLESAISAYGAGAFEYLPKPFDLDELVGLVEKAVGQNQARDHHGDPPPETPELLGEAPAMQNVFRAIGRLSRSDMSVLITGESGTGKELIARALHRHSPRASRPLIALNTAAIPADLLESELFGHEKGAFTGADQSRPGRFEQAHGGTLFLDEIGDMPLALQTRLLRVLAEGEFYRVGGREARRVDVRILAATHRNLKDEVAAGRFREDLYHRLNVIHLHVPALRERREDIASLAKHFLAAAAAELNTVRKRLLPATLDRLNRHDWPGNVRELENTCRWLTVMAPGQDISPSDLPETLLSPRARPSEPSWTQALVTWLDQRLESADPDIWQSTTDQLERTLIERALAQCDGHRQNAATALGIGRNTLTRKLSRLGLDADK